VTESCTADPCSGKCSVCLAYVNGTHSGYTATEYCFGTVYETNCPDCGKYDRYVVPSGSDCAVKDAVLEEYSDCAHKILGCPVCHYVYDGLDGDEWHDDKLQGSIAMEEYMASQDALLDQATGAVAYLYNFCNEMPTVMPGTELVLVYKCSKCGRTSYAFACAKTGEWDGQQLTGDWVSNGDGTHTMTYDVNDWFGEYGGVEQVTDDCTPGADGICTVCSGKV